MYWYDVPVANLHIILQPCSTEKNVRQNVRLRRSTLKKKCIVERRSRTFCSPVLRKEGGTMIDVRRSTQQRTTIVAPKIYLSIFISYIKLLLLTLLPIQLYIYDRTYIY